MDAVINFRIDKKTKNEAQDIAQKMGLSLSDILKVFLKSFVRNKSLEISCKAAAKYVKLVVFVPLPHVDAVRKALGDAGAGKIGNYDFCSFSLRGTGCFRGNEKSNPAVGKRGRLESVAEERIETIVPREILSEVIAKMKKAHPYEEVAFDIYPLEIFSK